MPPHRPRCLVSRFLATLCAPSLSHQRTPHAMSSALATAAPRALLSRARSGAAYPSRPALSRAYLCPQPLRCRQWQAQILRLPRRAAAAPVAAVLAAPALLAVSKAVACGLSVAWVSAPAAQPLLHAVSPAPAGGSLAHACRRRTCRAVPCFRRAATQLPRPWGPWPTHPQASTTLRSFWASMEELFNFSPHRLQLQVRAAAVLGPGRAGDAAGNSPNPTTRPPDRSCLPQLPPSPQYLPGTGQTGPLEARRYTLTHCDRSGMLQLSIGALLLGVLGEGWGRAACSCLCKLRCPASQRAAMPHAALCLLRCPLESTHAASSVPSLPVQAASGTKSSSAAGTSASCGTRWVRVVGGSRGACGPGSWQCSSVPPGRAAASPDPARCPLPPPAGAG